MYLTVWVVNMHPAPKSYGTTYHGVTTWYQRPMSFGTTYHVVTTWYDKDLNLTVPLTIWSQGGTF